MIQDSNASHVQMHEMLTSRASSKAGDAAS